MKTLVRLGIAAACTVPCIANADLIAQWNFNNSQAPSYGQGAATLIGGTTATFATGCTNDPAGSGNTGWNLAHFPSQGTNNLTAGVQFNVSTLGYSEISIRWDHRVSSTASKYCRLQYSTDGINFADFPTAVAAQQVSSSSSYFEPQTNSLAFDPAVNDNPNFAFRIVSEFESTALGYGADEYVTTYGTNTYRTTGTIRFDMLTVSGTHIPGANTPPQISALPDQTIRVNHSTGPLAFTVSDAEDPPENLLLDASSSNPLVIPPGNISFTGYGANRTATITASSQPGVSTITLSVIDSGQRSNSTEFVVTVLPANTAPVISSVPVTNLVAGAGPLSATLDFTIGDLESSPDDLVLTALSANPALLLNDSEHISFGGSLSNRTISLTPVPGLAGVAPITVSVSDGMLSSEASFALMVRPSETILLYDPFSYPDGSVVTNSGSLWDNRSGTNGDCLLSNGQLEITTARTEDVIARLAGAPYARSNGTVLYASFKMKFLGLPKSTAEYFAHFVGGTSLRGRVYAGAAESFPGAFHLFVANGSETNTAHAANLLTNSTYTVVTRYDLDAAVTVLWVNPEAESDPAAIATDPQTPVSISSYGFRQDSGLGTTVLVDDLKVGLSFAAVTSDTTPIAPIPLTFERAANRIILRWNDPSFNLQASPTTSGTFTNVPGATSPYTNTITGPAHFFRLYRAP
jgi:hypothetical protein